MTLPTFTPVTQEEEQAVQDYSEFLDRHIANLHGPCYCKPVSSVAPAYYLDSNGSKCLHEDRTQ